MADRSFKKSFDSIGIAWMNKYNKRPTFSCEGGVGSILTYGFVMVNPDRHCFGSRLTGAPRNGTISSSQNMGSIERNHGAHSE